MNYGETTWTGASGTIYKMKTFSLDTEVRPDIEGNYIFGERYKDPQGRIFVRPIYIGEGILKNRIEFRIQEGRVQQKGCNCFCAMINDNEASRKFIEDDLLAAYPQAYAPVGCNKKIGG